MVKSRAEDTWYELYDWLIGSISESVKMSLRNAKQTAMKL